MKNILLIFAIMAVSLSTAWAQKQDLNFNIEQVEPGEGNNLSEPVTENDLFGRYANITPISGLMQAAAEANNVANIRMEGRNNEASIFQDGTNNTGAININGRGNDADLTQTGSNLLSLITIQGDQNNLVMNQSNSSGTPLGNLIQVEGTGINAVLNQKPGSFTYQQGAQGSAMPLKIKGSSNNIPLIIRNN